MLALNTTAVASLKSSALLAGSCESDCYSEQLFTAREELVCWPTFTNQRLALVCQQTGFQTKSAVLFTGDKQQDDKNVRYLKNPNKADFRLTPLLPENR